DVLLGVGGAAVGASVSANVAREIRNGVAMHRLITQSRAVIIQRDDGEAARQLLNKGRRPCSRVEAIAHYEYKRRALSAYAVGYSDAVHFGKAHPHLASRTRALKPGVRPRPPRHFPS